MQATNVCRLLLITCGLYSSGARPTTQPLAAKSQTEEAETPTQYAATAASWTHQPSRGVAQPYS